MVRFWLQISLTFFVAVSFIDSSAAFGSSDKMSSQRNTVERRLLAVSQFRPWTWMQSNCHDCELYILPLRNELRTSEVAAFIKAVVSYKRDLLHLYDIHGAEYNLLAHMAIGILGRESRFFRSPRYKIKEASPGLIHVVKIIESYLDGYNGKVSPNSRGPTQIKIVPTTIAATYHVTTENLHLPENAALATMGFLIESLAELKRRVVINNLEFVTPETYADYLPYLYFGSRGQLLAGAATPDQNIYIRDMRIYMSWVELYEREPRTPPNAG